MTTPYHFPHFDIDHEFFTYLNVVEPSCPQRIKEKNVANSDINHLSHTRTNLAFHSLNDHYQVVVNLEKK